MAERFNFLFRWFAGRFFEHFSLDPKMVEQLRDLESRGTVVYVMRYSSRLDYFLFNTLFARTGLRLSSFANGFHFYYYRPFHEALRMALVRKRGRPKEIEHTEDQEAIRNLIRGEPASLFLFLRTVRLTSSLMTPRSKRRQDELDLLFEVIRTAWDRSDKPVFVVPLALFWRKGPRTPNRFLNLSYGAAHRPSDLAKVASFLATYRDLSVKIGEPIDLQDFIAKQRHDGPQRVARKVRRSILIYLYREEKVVEGPTLRPLPRVLDQVLSDPGVRRAIADRAKEKNAQRAEADAEKMFREIAANMNSTLLAVLGAAVGWLFRRLFASIDVTGLERVAGYAKRNPIVLVPSHRSYFDFLILSWLFYMNFLVPPHILARENMAFGPFGYIFRRAGAFFMRADMDDPLYKQIFRAYVAYLVREGFTQEFFIEGGRSRTGKTRAPRFGVLSWHTEAFVPSTRRDLFYVPIAITYERLVEESTMVDELEGGEKTKESMVGLVRARKYLQRRFGSVHVSFGEPISLAAALGDKRVRFAREADSEALQGEKRAFVEQLGHRIVERINWAAVANATSVAAAVMLGSSHRGLLRSQVVERMRDLIALLRLQDVRLTAALLRDEGEFEESIAFLVRSDLLKRSEDPRGEILYYETSHQRALDMYRNSIVHYLAAPSFLARRLLRGATMKELREDLATWQDLLYQEFYAPRGEVLAAHCEAFLDHFERSGWIVREGATLRASQQGVTTLRYLAEQTRGVIEVYSVACSAIAELEGETTAKEFIKLAEQHFAQAALLGEAQRSEAANESTFLNLADLLVRNGILTTEKVALRRGSETRFARGERWDSLGELRERLAVALSDK